MVSNLNPDPTGELNTGIVNYKKVMIEDFHLDPAKFFGSIPISISDLAAFIAENPGLTGLRIYISKETADPQANDYGMSILPCDELDGTFADRLATDERPSKVITTACRVPPGCTIGSEFPRQ